MQRRTPLCPLTCSNQCGHTLTPGSVSWHRATPGCEASNRIGTPMIPGLMPFPDSAHQCCSQVPFAETTLATM